MVSKIDHLGVLVDDIDQNRALYEHLGLEVGTVERVPSFGVEIAFIRVGESLVELVEPIDLDTSLAADLEVTARTSVLHHVAFRVDDLAAQLAELRRAGVALADDTPRQGAGDAAVAFLERRAANGVRVELVERDREPPVG